MDKKELKQLIEEVINEGNINYDKWRRANNRKAIAKIVVGVEDPFGNKYRYVGYLRYKETAEYDCVYFTQSLVGGTSGPGIPFSISNMQNKPNEFFHSDEEVFFKEEDFNVFLDKLNTNPDKAIRTLLDETWEMDIEKELRKWIKTGVYKVTTFKIELIK